MHAARRVLACAARVHDIHALCPQFTRDVRCRRHICSGSHVGSHARHRQRANDAYAEREPFTDSSAFADRGYADAFANSKHTDASANGRDADAVTDAGLIAPTSRSLGRTYYRPLRAWQELTSA